MSLSAGVGPDQESLGIRPIRGNSGRAISDYEGMHRLPVTARR